MDIVGLRCVIEFEELSDHFKKKGIEAVIMEPSRVMGPLHVISAWEHSRRSFSNHTNRSKSPITEFILYMAGERQISKALSAMRPEKDECVIFFPDLRDADLSEIVYERDDTLIDPSEKKASVMGLEPKGMDITYEDLALEMVAMVDILKG